MIRTITFKTLLVRLAGAIGLTVDWTDGSLFTAKAPELAQFLSKANRTAWTAYDWPESLVEEENYGITDGYLVPYDDVGDGSYAEIWTANPDTDESAMQLRYRNGTNGLVIAFGDRPAAGATVFLRYRGDAPMFSLTALTGSEIAGDIAYHAATGNCYGALVNNPGTTVTDTSKWALQPVLAILAQAVIDLAHASWLIQSGQPTVAPKLEADALGALDDEWGEIAAHDRRFKTSRGGRW